MKAHLTLLALGVAVTAAATAAATPIAASTAAEAQPSVADEGAAAEKPPRWVPTAGFATGFVRDRIQIELPTGSIQETNTLWHTRVNFGLGYDILPLGSHGVLAGHSAVGFGLVYEPGDWMIQTRHSVGPQWAPNDWFRLGIGLSAALHLDTGRLSHSYADIGLPISVRLSVVEFSYTPLIPLPFGQQSEAVFGGERSEQLDLSLVYAHFGLRFRVPPLGW